VTELVLDPATELAQRYRNGSLSPTEVVESVLDRLEAAEPAIKAVVTVTADLAREQAKDAEARLRSGEEVPPLCGTPVTVKDLVDTAGIRTTYGSKDMAGNVPKQDAISRERLRRTGAILIAKTTTPEHGLLGVTKSQLTGTTGALWDPSRTSGGSSGGAGAALAPGIAPLALGSDGGGSTRVPASCCGVVGLKPSTGRIPLRHNTGRP
jgi:Asp-tRNA(Asn)/Glu-tRNA(Gln) amidotransferase A subunit family amidase